MSNEILKWPLAAYGKIIRGDDTTSEDQVAEAVSDEMARRIVACVNFCNGIQTEKLEVKTLAEYMTSQTMITSMGPNGDGGFGIHFEGGMCGLIINAFAEQFKESGAINYLECHFISDDIGPMTVTIQRLAGQSPHQLRSEAEIKCSKLIHALKAIAFATAPNPDDGSEHENAYTLAMDAIEKFEAKL